MFKMMKTCNECGEKKNISQFQKSKRKEDGVSPSCKKCISKYRRSLSLSASMNGRTIDTRIENTVTKLRQYRKQFEELELGQIVEVTEKEFDKCYGTATNKCRIVHKTSNLVTMQYLEKPYKTSANIGDLVSRNVIICSEV
jgi:hypothetical protein